MYFFIKKKPTTQYCSQCDWGVTGLYSQVLYSGLGFKLRVYSHVEGVTEESVKTIDGLRNAIHHFCANSFAVHYERRYTRCRLYLDSVEVIPRPGIGSLSQKHASPNKSLPISNLLNSLDKTLCENDLRTFWSSAQTTTSTTQLP